VRRILFLARAEALHVVRDRATLAQALVVPVVQLLVLSNAATFLIRNTPTYVVDFDRSTASRELVERFAASGHFRIDGVSASPALADAALLRGDATMVLTIPRAFESSLVRTGAAPVELAVNAEKGSAAGIVQAYASTVVSRYAAELSTTRGASLLKGEPSSVERDPFGLRDTRRPTAAASAKAVRRATIDLRTRNRYNATLDYTHYMVPGILVALVTLIGTLLTAQNIAREKELGTLEQLNVTPITRGQFIAAKLLPFWMLGLVDLAIGLVVARLVFGVPMRGSVALLFGAGAVYLVTALAIGLWISALVETQQQAMFVTFFVMSVYLLMSGLFTPIDSMAPWVQVISQANPVRHFVAISRAVLVKGAGVREIAQPLATLVVFGAVTLTLAIRQYSKRTA
jgi:ABC-2 type transport system permease protein